MLSRFVSAVNQPSRVFLNSNNDQSNDPSSNETYADFRINFPSGILKPVSTQLTRASIPNVQLSIPDYQLVFFYIRIPNASPGLEYKIVRFLPSTFDTHDPDQDLFGLPVNRLIANYQDFVNLLNQAAAAADDPTNVDPVSGDPLHVANDVTFAYDALTRQITMTGNDSDYTYLVPGFSDTEITALIPSIKLNLVLSTITVSTTVQPQIPLLPMNLRVGFSSQNTKLNSARADGIAIYPSSWGDLVYTQNVYVYSNIVQGASLGSGGQRNLLAVIPTNAPPLGVTQYTAPMTAPLTRIVQEIFEIQILMYDDNNQPYEVQNNAIVAIELTLSY